MHLSQLVNADHPLDEHAIQRIWLSVISLSVQTFRKKNASLLRKQPWPLQIYLYAQKLLDIPYLVSPGIAPIVANRNCTIWRRLRNGQRWLPREPASTRWDLRWMYLHLLSGWSLKKLSPGLRRKVAERLRPYTRIYHPLSTGKKKK